MKYEYFYCNYGHKPGEIRSFLTLTSQTSIKNTLPILVTVSAKIHEIPSKNKGFLNFSLFRKVKNSQAMF